MTPTRPPRNQYRQNPPIRRTRPGYIDAPVLAPHTPEAVAPRLDLQHAGGVGQHQFHTPQLEDDSVNGHEDGEGEEEDLEGEEEDEEEEGGIEEGAFLHCLDGVAM